MNYLIFCFYCLVATLQNKRNLLYLFRRSETGGTLMLLKTKKNDENLMRPLGIETH